MRELDAAGRARLPLRTLVTRIVWAALLPQLLVAGWLASAEVRDVWVYQDQQAAELVRSVVAGMDTAMTARMDTLSALAASPLLDEPGDLATFHRTAQGFAAVHGSQLLVVAPDGTMQLNSRLPYGSPLPPLLRPPGRAALPEALRTGQPAAGDVVYAPAAKMQVVALAVPVLREGRAVRVLITTVNVASIQQRLDARQVPPGWTVTVSDSVGALVAQRPPAGASVAMATPSGATWLPAARLHSASLQRAPWRVTVTVPDEVARAPLLTASLQMAGLLLAAALTGLLGGRWASRRLTSDLDALGREPVVGGEVSRIHPSPIHEIAQVQQHLADAAEARQRDAANLVASEQRFRGLFDNSPMPQALVASDGRVLAVNGRFTEVFGYTLEDAPTIEDWARQAYPDPELRARMARRRAAAIREAAEHGRVGGLSAFPVRCKSGEQRIAISEIVAMGDDRLLTLQDVTQRVQAEQQLRKLSQAVEQSHEAIVITDLQARIDYVNEAFVRSTGYARDEVLGRDLRLLQSEDTSAESSAAMWQSLADGRPWQGEWVNQRRDGSSYVAETIVSPLRDADGQVIHYVAVQEDVTEQRRIEHELDQHRHHLEALVARRTQELEAARAGAVSASRAKSAFLANMSHEIRTPMNAIIGLTHLMRREVSDDAQRERLTKVDAAARHLLQLINDVLDLSKIEAGKMTLEDTEFALDGLLAGVFEMVAEQARGKGLELVLDTDHLPARLRGDPVRLSQALINLLSNAVKFTAQGWVRLRGELLGEHGDRMRVRFEVQDTGEGIAPERQGALFHAFEQADNAINRRHGGTGLGLALTRHIAEMMGGEVGLHSVPGEGSRFWFTATLCRAAEAGDRAAPLSLQGLRALLVDDLAEARQAIADQLQLLGLSVHAVASGEQALTHLADEMRAARPYDVLLLDWRMAPMDGVETLHAARRLMGEGLPPAILVTAFDDPQLVSQAREAAFGTTLLKPITPSLLHDGLMRVLRRSSGSRPLPLAERSDTQAEVQLRQQHAGQRVLLVEDNPVNQEVARELLITAGLVVECAGDGAEALARVRQRPYELVLMDVQMPGMDGLSATRAIRAELGEALPIVAMTANAFSEDRRQCLAAGMNDHVAKPVDPEQLYAALLRWLPLPTRPGRPSWRIGAVLAEAASATVLTPPPAGPSLSERLQAVEGFDLSHALSHMGGTLAVLARVLRGFVDTYRDGVASLRAPLCAADLVVWRAACHSLYGACSTVGASALAEQLFQLRALGDALLAPGAAVASPATVSAEVLADLQASSQAIDQQLRALAERLALALGDADGGRGTEPRPQA